MENTECKFCTGITVENGICRNCGQKENAEDEVAAETPAETEPVPSEEVQAEPVAEAVPEPISVEPEIVADEGEVVAEVPLDPTV